MYNLETLSDIQRDIVLKGSGLFVVRAAAGSGKTYTVAAKIAYLNSSWQKKGKGIAIISFTNTAWIEIGNTLKKDFGINDLGHPHFVGTIDSFLNKYIFLPFGNLVMGCKGRPKLVGAPHGPWRGGFYKDSFFDKITYSKEGELYFPNPRSKPDQKVVNGVLARKTVNTKAGFATQSDANYFSLLALKKYPWVAKALVTRFPYIIVDEAQDTSDIQMEILDLLISAGLKEVMLVGDPDQAIYEWRSSKPELFVEKYNQWESRSFILNESRRSSQAICNFAFNLSSLKEIPIAVDEEVKNCALQPEIITMEGKSAIHVADEFIQKCIENGISPTENKVGIIFRSRGFYQEFDPDYLEDEIRWTDDLDLFEIVLSKFQFEKGLVQKSVHKLAFLYARKLKKTTDISKEQLHEIMEEFGIAGFRKKILGFLKALPTLKDSTIKNWCDLAGEMIKQELDIEVSFKRTCKDLLFDKLIRDDETLTLYKGCRLGTVHQVKGETFDAVLVLLKAKGIGKSYINLIKDEIPVYQSEELRSVYVALTRPKKLLMLAVPDSKNAAAWKKALQHSN